MKRLLGPLALVAVLSLLAGCGDDQPEPATAPSDSPSSNSPNNSPGAPDTGSSGSPSDRPSVEPATGPVLEQDHISVASPEGWTLTPESDERSGQAGDDEGSLIFLSELPDFAPGAEVDLGRLARDAVRSGFYVRDPEILAPVEIGGVEWFHLSGPIDAAQHLDAYGTITGGVQLDLKITTPRPLPDDERRAIIDTTLASVVLR